SFLSSGSVNNRHGSEKKRRGSGRSRRSSGGSSYHRDDLHNNGFGNGNRSFNDNRNGNEVPRKPRFF
ncbi:hypothetical protein, partial [Ehrlichia ruminantium]